METARVITQASIETGNLPEEVRQALDALRAGRPAAEDVFFLRGELTTEQRQQKVLLAKGITIGILAFGLAIGLVAAYSDAPQTGAGIFGMELVGSIVLWVSWVQETQQRADDPWRESMICTPGYLLVITMGMVRLFELKNWTEARVITRPGKYNRYVLYLILDSGETNLGFVDDTGKKTVDAFVEKLQHRILAIANSHAGA